MSPASSMNELGIRKETDSLGANDSFPSVMNIAAAIGVKRQLIPAVRALQDAMAAKAEEWLPYPTRSRNTNVCPMRPTLGLEARRSRPAVFNFLRFILPETRFYLPRPITYIFSPVSAWPFTPPTRSG
jgi:hypothetical protein